ncbi:DNA/RNA nuclease SfsA [Caldifermentibacillus hisashii]|uniref:DNA/RNA nuclease SfsA n=1 Tax=Caldifermentibacillus hisashii TaxID=996558 RepID=UPI0034D41ABD
MKYGEIVHGKLHRRVNRFIAEVFIHGKKEAAHIKNTGRLTELLQPDADVRLEVNDNPNRKTKYSLIAVCKNDIWVNIDSQAPNTVVFEAITAGKVKELGMVNTVKREVLFVVQMKGCSTFAPNKEMDKTFTAALLKAVEQGVQILAYDAIVKVDELVLGDPLPVVLS